MKHKHADLIHAWADGAEIEYLSLTEPREWNPAMTPQWEHNTEYRIKPEIKLNPVDNLRLTVFTVLEGWTLPHDVRKILEAAYYDTVPTISNAGSETNIPVVGIAPKGKGVVSLHNKEWVGMTDDEINKIVDLNTSDDGGFDIWCDGIAVARIVCAKLKERNT